MPKPKQPLILRREHPIRRFLRREAPFDFAGAGVSTVGLAAGGFRLSLAGEAGWAWGLWIAAAVGLLLAGWKAWNKWNREAAVNDPHTLDGVLFTLWAILSLAEGVGKTFKEPKLRLTIFAPAGNGEVVQLTNYASFDPDVRTGVGRTLPTTKGIVGLAMRTGEPKFDPLPKNRDRVAHLVKVYGFDRKEAEAMRPDAAAWCAVPVGRKDAPVAVIFADAAVGDFFGNANSPRRQVLEAATLGVAAFVNRP